MQFSSITIAWSALLFRPRMKEKESYILCSACAIPSFVTEDFLRLTYKHSLYRSLVQPWLNQQECDHLLSVLGTSQTQTPLVLSYDSGHLLGQFRKQCLLLVNYGLSVLMYTPSSNALPGNPGTWAPNSAFCDLNWELALLVPMFGIARLFGWSPKKLVVAAIKQVWTVM